MRRENRLIRTRHALAHGAEHLVVFLGRRVADRVGQVDRRRASLDGGFHAAAEIVDAGARRVHGAPLDILDQVARPRNRGRDDLEHLGFALAHLVREMDRRRRNERVDAPAFGMAHGLAGAVDVAGDGAGKTGDSRLLHALRDRRHGLEVAFGGDRKTGFDDVDAHGVEAVGNLELLLEGHGRAGALLAVAQRGVEDDDAVACGDGSSSARLGFIRLRHRGSVLPRRPVLRLQ